MPEKKTAKKTTGKTVAKGVKTKSKVEIKSSSTASKTTKKTAPPTSNKKTTAKKPVVKKTTVKNDANNTKIRKKIGTDKKVSNQSDKMPAKKIAVRKVKMSDTSLLEPETKPVRKTAKAVPKASPSAKKSTASKKTNLSAIVSSPSTDDYMNEEDLLRFTAILNDWKTELMQEVDRTVLHMKDESANLPDPADRASQEEEFTFELRTRDRERKLIKKIDQALESIDNKDYGYCESCGVEIGLKRLEARPTATLCIDCKTLDEIKEKQIRG